MPKHKFDGRWNYFEIPHDGEPREPSEGPDMVLSIPEEDGDVIKDKSRQGNFLIDGNATNKTISLTRGEPPNHRELKGKVVSEVLVNGERHIVIAGTFKDHDGDNVKADNQQEGTWVVTKP